MKLLIFAGTSEGRALCEFLSQKGISATACVATDYGQMVMPSLDGITVRVGRLETGEMETLMSEFDIVVDATHPYASVVTEHIRKACRRTNTEYLRLLRPASEAKNVVRVDSAAAAAEYLNTVSGSALLTTGSKELEAFTAVEGYAERLFVRVLPTPEVVQKCVTLGYKGRQLICMQGPFSYEMNAAMLKQTGTSFLVTKDTGDAGGFDAKLSAARKLGITVILISRPTEETGFTMEEIKSRFSEISRTHQSHRPFPLKFPMFLDLTGRKAVVVGAGHIASRRIETLRKFGARITVVAPEVLREIPDVNYLRREYREGDAEGAFLVVAATDSREVNHAVASDCKKFGIQVSVADCVEECTFFFPAVCTSSRLVAGVVSDGTDHHLTTETAKKIREIIGD